MRPFIALFKREMFAYFVTPLAWVLVTAFLIVQGLHFYFVIDQFAAMPGAMGDESPLQVFFAETVLPYLVLFLLVPPLTMRTFAEERRSGTIETLLTTPITPTAVVLAKYAAALATYVVMWAPTLLYVVILKRAGGIDRGAVLASYLGVLLVGAAYLSIGVLMSALTSSQFLALVFTALVILVFFVVGLGEFVTKEGTTLHEACAYVSVWSQMEDFAAGVVDTRRLVFDGSLIVVPLFFAVRIVDAWRWS